MRGIGEPDLQRSAQGHARPKDKANVRQCPGLRGLGKGLYDLDRGSCRSVVACFAPHRQCGLKNEATIVLALVAVFCLAGCTTLDRDGASQNSAPTFPGRPRHSEAPAKDKRSVAGKYPGNLITTQTAKTLPKGKSLAILSASYTEYTKQRIAGRMRSMPSGMESDSLITTLVLQHGITDRLQLGLVAPFVWRHFEYRPRGIQEHERGLGDVVLTSKYALLQETENFPGFALGLGLKLPTGEEDRKLGTGEFDASLFAACSKRTGDVSFHGSLQYIATGGSRDDLGPRADDKFICAGAVLWHCSRRVTFLGELARFDWGDVGSSVGFTPGVLWSVSDSLSVRGGVTIPLHTDMPFGYDIRPTLGLCYRF